MASPLVPDGVLLSTGDFIFIETIMRLDDIIDEAISSLRDHEYSNLNDVYKTVRLRLAQLEEEKEDKKEEKVIKLIDLEEEEGDEVFKDDNNKLPGNRAYYVFTEIYDALAKGPFSVAANFFLEQSTNALSEWLNDNFDGDFVDSIETATSIISEICELYQRHEVTGSLFVDESQRDVYLELLGLSPTEDFLRLTAFTPEQKVILQKFISIGDNYKKQFAKEVQVKIEEEDEEKEIKMSKATSSRGSRKSGRPNKQRLLEPRKKSRSRRNSSEDY